MGICSLAGVPFKIDPESVWWDFTARVNETKTVGGKVIQVFGVVLGDMNISGWFGSGGLRDQQNFLNRMRKMAEAQEIAPGQRGSDPVKFQYPGRGWDFLVYLKAYSQPGGQQSVALSNPVLHNLRWHLVLHIVEENAGLKVAAQDLFIQRLSEGLGWSPLYHGPLGDALEATLAGKSEFDYATGLLKSQITALTPATATP